MIKYSVATNINYRYYRIYLIHSQFTYIVDSSLMLLNITIRHCRKIIPSIGDMSMPKIIGIVPLNSLKYGSVSLFSEQKGSLYQFTVGNHASDNFSKINIRYISEKLATDVKIKLKELVTIFMLLIYIYHY